MVDFEGVWEVLGLWVVGKEGGLGGGLWVGRSELLGRFAHERGGDSQKVEENCAKLVLAHSNRFHLEVSAAKDEE